MKVPIVKLTTPIPMGPTQKFTTPKAQEHLHSTKKKGEDKWVGRRIIKTFGDHGDFEGVVYAVDDDANKPGYRLFAVHYFEDPDDGELMWPEELFQ